MLRRLQRLWGYGVASLLIFFFVFFIKGYEVTKVTGVTGVTLAIKGSFPHQIQGYRVTSLLNFFPKYFFTKRLRGYQGYQGYRGYDGPPSRGRLLIKFKVTRLQVYQRDEFFF